MCPSCGAARSPTARFCPGCGAPAGGTLPAPGARTPWLVAGAAILILLVTLIISLARQSTPPVAAATPADEAGPAGTPPDISRMSPRERFDRLYNRIMGAAQSGDQATVTQFTPMALLAYGQLDSIDADARYHAALLRVHTGDADAAMALADTILARDPNHLFGFMIRGTVARWRKDDKALSRANRDFLYHYDAEMKAGRPEYKEHQPALEEFRRTASQLH